ncbi:MAG: hypothetical protein KDA24_23815 [Deltaproteobacteria bacterium]|nr:hypothetical protein [Deltaproteobacteria bacterium]
MRIGSSLLSLVLLTSLGALVGCPTGDTPEPIDSTVTWIEDDDGDNDEFDDPEEVDAVWTDTLVIEGTARECDWDNDEDWPWQGDLDNYLIFSPERGFMEAILEWEDDLDLDLMQIVIEDNTITTGETSQNNDQGEGSERILFEEEFREDEELHLQVACAVGDDGDYTLTIVWEE